MRLRSYSVREHVCRISLTYCLDEERQERCSIDSQGFVVPKEEASSIGCYRHVEGCRGDAHLATEARAMVGQRHEPVIGRQPRVDVIRIAHVVVRHGDCAPRFDGYGGREGRNAGGGLADHGRCAPVLPAVGGRGEHNLVDCSAGESSVFPDYVQLLSARVDGDRGQAVTGTKECAVGGEVIRQHLVRDGCRPRPGVAAVGRRDDADAEAPRYEVGRAGRLDQLEEVVEDVRLGIDHDHVADGLAVLPGIEDRLGARPGLAAVGGLGEPGRAEECVSAEVRIRAVARGLEAVPHDVGRAGVDWICGDGLLVVEELGELEDGAGPLVGLDQVWVAPSFAAIGRGEGRDAGVVVAAADAGCGIGRQQADGVRDPIRLARPARPDGDPGIRGPVVRRPGEGVQDRPGAKARAEGQVGAAPGLSTIE